MPESLSPFTPFALFVVAVIIFSIFRDRRCRKTRSSILRRIERKKAKAVCLDTKTIRKATSFLSFSVNWENAEVIITEGAVLYFSYASLLDYRLYSDMTHWHLNDEAIPPQIRHSTPIKSLKIMGGSLVINASENHANISTTFQDVASSGQLEVIKKMLQMSQAR